MKAPVPLGRIFSRLFTIEINSEIANNLKPIRMMKMQCVTINLNIKECVSVYMKIHHDRFWTFYGHFANEARNLRTNKSKWEHFLRNMQIVQNITWMIPISFDRNDNCADWFQIVRDCSIASIVNKRLSGTVA